MSVTSIEGDAARASPCEPVAADAGPLSSPPERWPRWLDQYPAGGRDA